MVPGRAWSVSYQIRSFYSLSVGVVKFGNWKVSFLIRLALSIPTSDSDYIDRFVERIQYGNRSNTEVSAGDPAGKAVAFVL
jgi:hypothetical protein